MIFNERVKHNLLTWNDKEPIFKQFEKKCEKLSNLTGLVIDPYAYQLQYQLHVANKNYFINLQTKLYEMLYKKYPNVEFGMAGRLKSPFSHYEKVIRKFVYQFEKDEIRPVSILDDYAIKIFLRHINYPIDKLSIDDEGIYIDYGTNEFRFKDGDAFVFEHEGKSLTIAVEKGASNIWIDHTTPYICTTRNGKEISIPLDLATTYKRSSDEHLVKYCYEFQDATENFFNTLIDENKKDENEKSTTKKDEIIDDSYITKKKKDYIENRKESGYASLQMSFYSKRRNLGIECQTRTQDMERFNNEEREYGYKPNEHTISYNSLSQTSQFTFTTKFKDGGFQTFEMSEGECFELIFGIPLDEYSKQMMPTLTPKKDNERKDDGAR